MIDKEDCWFGMDWYKANFTTSYMAVDVVKFGQGSRKSRSNRNVENTGSSTSRASKKQGRL